MNTRWLCNDALVTMVMQGTPLLEENIFCIEQSGEATDSNTVIQNAFSINAVGAGVITDAAKNLYRITC